MLTIRKIESSLWHPYFFYAAPFRAYALVAHISGGLHHRLKSVRPLAFSGMNLRESVKVKNKIPIIFIK